jgi:hypothetical protein
MKAPKYAIGQSKVFFVLVPGKHTPLVNIHNVGVKEISYFEGNVGGVRVNKDKGFDYEVFNHLYSGWLEEYYLFKTEKEAVKLVDALISVAE